MIVTRIVPEAQGSESLVDVIQRREFGNDDAAIGVGEENRDSLRRNISKGFHKQVTCITPLLKYCWWAMNDPPA